MHWNDKLESSCYWSGPIDTVVAVIVTNSLRSLIFFYVGFVSFCPSSRFIVAFVSPIFRLKDVRNKHVKDGLVRQLMFLMSLRKWTLALCGSSSIRFWRRGAEGMEARQSRASPSSSPIPGSSENAPPTTARSQSGLSPFLPSIASQPSIECDYDVLPDVFFSKQSCPFAYPGRKLESEDT